MSVVVPHRAVEKVSMATDPKAAIFETIGDITGIHLMADMVLLGTYIRPKRTAGGIWRPDDNVQEDVWQGKVGIILKLGPDAFEDTQDYVFNFGERGKPKVGDWVVFKVGDAWSLNIKEFPCRYIRDTGIKMVIDDPGIIF